MKLTLEFEAENAHLLLRDILNAWEKSETGAACDKIIIDGKELSWTEARAIAFGNP